MYILKTDWEKGVLVFLYGYVPGRVSKLYTVADGPLGIDGLLRDEAVSAATCMFVNPVHSAFVYPAPFVVVVWHSTVI